MTTERADGEPARSEAPNETGATAARIAGGSSIVFAGGLVDRGLRFGVNWFLSGVLGKELFGAFTWAVTAASTVSSFAPLGLDTGIVLFAARYRRSGEQGRAKGALLFGLSVSLVMGLVCAALVVFGAPFFTDSEARLHSLAWVAALLIPWTPLLYLVGSLRAAKDMKRSALAIQIALPTVYLAGSFGLVGLGWGMDGAFFALTIATTIGLLAAARFAWHHYGSLVRDRAVAAVWEPRTLLAFSIPQGLTAGAFRLNGYMDVLMLSILASDADTGVYKVAAALAAFGTVPSNAVASMFNPFIAEMVYIKQTARLDDLLKTVTRWLIVVSAPVYLALLVLPDVVLGLYEPEYAVALVPLLVLVGAQAVQTACAPTMRLIPMSGHAVLNLVNGVAALVLNVALNAVLIPRMGADGAAWATGVTLIAWSVWRVVEVRWLLGCFPFDARSATIALVATVSGLGAASLGDGQTVLTRVALLAGTYVLVAGSVLAVSRTDADRALAQRVTQRLQRLRRSRKS